MINLFRVGGWQMTAGERAAMEGILCQLKPALAVEIGTAEGGSLACIASRAGEVHSFDLVTPAAEAASLCNVTLHTGDSHELLPAALQEFARADRNVDFVLIDGDHTSEGARRDLEDVVRSSAVGRTVILLHDTANEAVRAGLEAANIGEFEKVKAIDLDLVPGYLVKADPFHHEIWGGLGLVLIDESPEASPRLHLVSELGYPQPEILVAHRAMIEASEREQAGWASERLPAIGGSPGLEDHAAAQQVRELTETVSELERRLATVTGSKSWRMTVPLRRIAAKLRA